MSHEDEELVKKRTQNEGRRRRRLKSKVNGFANMQIGDSRIEGKGTVV